VNVHGWGYSINTLEITKRPAVTFDQKYAYNRVILIKFASSL
jgi:hypothetical protein